MLQNSAEKITRGPKFCGAKNKGSITPWTKIEGRFSPQRYGAFVLCPQSFGPLAPCPPEFWCNATFARKLREAGVRVRMSKYPYMDICEEHPSNNTVFETAIRVCQIKISNM